MLSHLAAANGQWVTFADIEDLIGPASGHRAATASAMHSAMFRLRRIFTDAELAACLQTGPNGYRLTAAEGQLDSEEMERLARSLRNVDVGGRSALVQHALSLWRGEPFGRLGASYDGLLVASERLKAVFLGLTEMQAEWDIDHGDRLIHLPGLLALVLEHPFHEPFWRLYMLALYRSGQQANAARAYDKCRTALAEVGLEPDGALKELHRAILAGVA